jgi:hypothetical protein
MKTKASLPVTITAVVVGVILVGLIACINLRPRGAPQFAVSATQQANNNWLTQKARECGGDFGKLSPADQQKAQELTQGKGAFVIGMIHSHSK